MAYFPNATAGMDYEDRYCSRCVHHADPDKGCVVLLLHALHNYDECNNPTSFLHILIPRSAERLDNEQCRMFIPSPDSATAEQA